MDPEKLYAKIGRQQILIEAQDEAYNALQNLLCGILTGAIAPSRVMVNRTDRTWTVAPEGQRPPMPATINGMPVCVTAIEPE